MQHHPQLRLSSPITRDGAEHLLARSELPFHGYPDEEHLRRWSRILEQHGIARPEEASAVLDTAVTAAARTSEWRNWGFLTLQVQLAAERVPTAKPDSSVPTKQSWNIPNEDPACDWAMAKRKIRDQIGQVSFANWFYCSRQVARRDGQITIAVWDEATRFFLETEYGILTRAVLADFWIEKIDLTLACSEPKTDELGDDTNERA